MADNTSPGVSATQQSSGQPATGNATGSATPPAATLSLEDAMKRIAELEQHAQNKTEEASRHGTKLTAAEKELAAYKAAEQAARDAQLSEVERVKSQFADLQAQHEALAAELYEARVFQEVSKLSGKFNFIVSADTLARMLLLDDDAIEFEDGKPQNIEKLLDKLAKAEQGLVKTPEQQAQQQARVPNLPGMSPDRATYGRSSIGSPGGNVPGRIPRLTDPGMFKT